MPPVPQMAQQISQEENQLQNGPNLSNLLNSLRAAHSRSPALPQQVQPAGWDKNHVLVLPAPVPSQQQHTDWSLFDVIGMENQITCYEAQMLPKLKGTGKFIEEISCSPSSPRLEPVKLQPNRDLCVFPVGAVASSMFVWSNSFKSFLHMDPWNESPAVQSRGTEMVQCDSGVSHSDVVPVVFYDTDLDLLMDTKMGWCDKHARGRDTHTYRLVSGNSAEERLLKKTIKHMIEGNLKACSGKGLFNRLFIPGLGSYQ